MVSLYGLIYAYTNRFVAHFYSHFSKFRFDSEFSIQTTIWTKITTCQPKIAAQGQAAEDFRNRNLQQIHRFVTYWMRQMRKAKRTIFQASVTDCDSQLTILIWRSAIEESIHAVIQNVNVAFEKHIPLASILRIPFLQIPCFKSL